MGGDICNQFGPGGRADLVIDDIERFPLLGQAQHGFGEVVASAGIHPAGAEYQMLAAAGLNGLLAGQLGGAVDVEGAGAVCFFPGLVARAIEHIVGGVMHQAATLGFHQLSHQRRGMMIQLSGQLGVALCLVDGSVGRGVNQHIRFDLFDRVAEAFKIADVTAQAILASTIQRDDLAQRSEGALELPANLTVLAEQQYCYGLRPCHCAQPAFDSVCVPRRSRR